MFCFCFVLSSPAAQLQKQVILTKSVEFMPFYLSLFSLLTSFTWMLYGILGRDPYLTVIWIYSLLFCLCFNLLINFASF